MNIPLKTRMLELGISQFRVARDVELSDSYLSKIVQGWVNPSEKIKIGLAAALGCKPGEIFPENNRGNPDEPGKGSERDI